jgi:hypothetical protein
MPEVQRRLKAPALKKVCQKNGKRKENSDNFSKFPFELKNSQG